MRVLDRSCTKGLVPSSGNERGPSLHVAGSLRTAVKPQHLQSGFELRCRRSAGAFCLLSAHAACQPPQPNVPKQRMSKVYPFQFVLEGNFGVLALKSRHCAVKFQHQYL